MIHSFNVKMAEEYGVTEAILIQHIYYWVNKNRENCKNFHNGKYWTYNSIKAYTELFPYLSEHKIRGALKKLEENDMLLVENFNTNKFDKTLWYTTTDKAGEILTVRNSENVKSNIEKTTARNSENAKSHITDINITINTTDMKPHTQMRADFERFWEVYQKKVCKTEAEKAFYKLNPNSELLEKMILAVKNFAKTESWQTDNGRYIPFAVNWINQQRWNDEVPCISEKKDIFTMLMKGNMTLKQEKKDRHS